jgi:nucleoside phosphorylase
MSEPVGAVILTPMSLEYKAVRAHLQDSRRVWHEAGTGAEVGTVPGVPWPVAVVLTGEGNGDTGTLVERVSAWLQPRALLVVGVAGGLKDDIDLGDVVVATWVYQLQSGKEDSEGYRSRPRAWPSDYRLQQAARAAEVDGTWAGSLPAQPSVHFKPIAAGDVVLNSRTSPLAQQLRQYFDDAVAIEMESAGAMSAAHLIGTLPVLTIRGISDKADGRKHLSDAAGLQPAAAAHAAAFAMAVLRELPGAAAANPGQALSSRAGPTDPGPGWRPLTRPLTAVWASGVGVPRARGRATVELCLLAAGPGPALAAKCLAALPAELAALGRAAGVFAPCQEIPEAGSPAAVAGTAEAGLAVTRSGARCGWQPLPQDTVGAVLDQEDLAARLAALLRALTGIDAPHPLEAGLAVAVVPSIMLAEGRVADLPRTSVRGRTSLAPLEVPAADVLPWGHIAACPADVAEELSERLLLAFRSRQGSAGK